MGKTSWTNLLLLLFMMGGMLLAKPPDCFLITLDTTRADHLEPYGYPLPTTPFLKELAKKSTVFMHAYTPVPLTFPAHASLFTGELPLKTGIHDNIGFTLSEDIPLLQEIFRKHGYETTAFVSAIVLGKKTGLARGFDYYDDEMTQKTPNQLTPQERWAKETVKRVQAYLRKRDTRKPLFLWVHLFDPHYPYHTHGYPSLEPYDQEIRYMDEALADLLRNLQEERILILVGDHGEGLKEHGEYFHGVFLYEPTVHIPLIIRLPKQTPQVIPTPVSLCDLFPTLLDYFGWDRHDGWGKSLWPLMKGNSTPVHESFFFESLFPAFNFGWAYPLAIMKGGWKYIHLPKPELYDLKKDSKEKENRVTSHQKLARTLRDQLLSQYPLLKTPSPKNPKFFPLASLGYLSGSKPSQKDPKDFIWIEKGMVDGKEALDQGDYLKGEKVFLKITQENPENFVAWVELGLVRKLMGKYPEAIQAFHQALKIHQDNLIVHYNLGVIYFNQGNLSQSEKHFEEVLKRDPTISDAALYLCHIHLKKGAYKKAKLFLDKAKKYAKQENYYFYQGLYYAYQKQYSSACEAFQKALAIKPDYWEALFNLAQGYYQGGKKQKSIEVLKDLLRRNPNFPSAYLTLASIYLEDNKDVGSARRLFETFVQRFPRHPETPHVKEILKALP